METPGGDYFELSLGRRRSIPPQLRREVAATECVDRRAIWPRAAPRLTRLLCYQRGYRCTSDHYCCTAPVCRRWRTASSPLRPSSTLQLGPLLQLIRTTLQTNTQNNLGFLTQFTSGSCSLAKYTKFCIVNWQPPPVPLAPSPGYVTG